MFYRKLLLVRQLNGISDSSSSCGTVLIELFQKRRWEDCMCTDLKSDMPVMYDATCIYAHRDLEFL